MTKQELNDLACSYSKYERMIVWTIKMNGQDYHSALPSPMRGKRLLNLSG